MWKKLILKSLLSFHIHIFVRHWWTVQGGSSQNQAWEIRSLLISDYLIKKGTRRCQNKFRSKIELCHDGQKINIVVDISISRIWYNVIKWNKQNISCFIVVSERCYNHVGQNDISRTNIGIFWPTGEEIKWKTAKLENNADSATFLFPFNLFLNVVVYIR